MIEIFLIKNKNWSQNFARRLYRFVGKYKKRLLIKNVFIVHFSGYYFNFENNTEDIYDRINLIKEFPELLIFCKKYPGLFNIVLIEDDPLCYQIQKYQYYETIIFNKNLYKKFLYLKSFMIKTIQNQRNFGDDEIKLISYLHYLPDDLTEDLNFYLKNDMIINPKIKTLIDLF